jgi:hypothetical protein
VFADPADPGVYVGLGLGQATLDGDLLGEAFNGSDVGWSVVAAGWQPLRWLALEASYFDFGAPTDTIQGVEVEVSGKGYEAAAIAILPLGRYFSIQARAGYLWWAWEATARAGGQFAKADNSGRDPIFGGAVAFHHHNTTIKIDYQQSDIEGLDASVLQLAVLWKFPY